MKKCCVIGSINMDMVTRTDVFPKPGETRVGRSFQTIPGGKGANQAIALSRLGVPTAMAGMVGDDLYGSMYQEHFAQSGTDLSAVGVSGEAGTGVAAIEVDDAGENHIVVVPGANSCCTPVWFDGLMPQWAQYDIFLLQLEIPMETVERAVCALREMGKTIILDPAPAQPLSGEILSRVDILTPNATELRTLTASMPEEADTRERVDSLLRAGVHCVVHKSGSKGAYIGQAARLEHVEGFRVKAVDSTAAGDTFNAGLAAGLSMGWTLERAVRLANAAAALSVTKLGAQTGMPSLEEAFALMGAQEDIEIARSVIERCIPVLEGRASPKKSDVMQE